MHKMRVCTHTPTHACMHTHSNPFNTHQETVHICPAASGCRQWQCLHRQRSLVPLRTPAALCPRNHWCQSGHVTTGCPGYLFKDGGKQNNAQWDLWFSFFMCCSFFSLLEGSVNKSCHSQGCLLTNTCLLEHLYNKHRQMGKWRNTFKSHLANLPFMLIVLHLHFPVYSQLMHMHCHYI